MIFFNRKYKKRVAELEEELEKSKKRIYRTEKAIRDFVVNKTSQEEIIAIVTSFQLGEDMEAILWFGESTKNENESK